MIQTTGRIHSFESFGTLDGPGIRTVVFLAGCPLRCQYCHNIDVVLCDRPQEMSVEMVLKKLEKNKPYFDSSGGGVTLSGGDPLMQADFCANLIAECHTKGIHTCLDTALFGSPQQIEKVLDADLFLISVKHFDSKKHKSLTGVSNELILKNIRTLKEKGKQMWLRFLVLPGVTDTPENWNAFEDFCLEIHPEKVEILPYHTMGVQKWKDLDQPYVLENIPEPTEEHVRELCIRLASLGLNVGHTLGASEKLKK